MRKYALNVVACAFLAQGCTSSTVPTFSWYHPEGGEYLFDFDSAACEREVENQGRSLGTDTSGPYFNCMKALGYMLVDRPLLAVPRDLGNSTAENSGEG